VGPVGTFAPGEALPCRVVRSDGATLSPKHLACSMTSVDADGNPRVTVPVDQKIQD
jgi:hypothetical protein